MLLQHQHTYIKSDKRGFTITLKGGSISYDQGTNSIIIRPNDLKRATTIFVSVGELQQIRNALNVVLETIG